jgi:hypothetical protein
VTDQFRGIKASFKLSCLAAILLARAGAWGLDFEAELEKQNSLSETLTESVLERKARPLSDDAKKLQIRLISATEPVSIEDVQAH